MKKDEIKWYLDLLSMIIWLLSSSTTRRFGESWIPYSEGCIRCIILNKLDQHSLI